LKARKGEKGDGSGRRNSEVVVNKSKAPQLVNNLCGGETVRSIEINELYSSRGDDLRRMTRRFGCVELRGKSAKVSWQSAHLIPFLLN